MINSENDDKWEERSEREDVYHDAQEVRNKMQNYLFIYIWNDDSRNDKTENFT